MSSAFSRQEGVKRVCTILQRAGFFLYDLHNTRPSSFDLIARRDSTLLLIKVLKNIDALGPEEANRLRTQARLLHGTPLLVGHASGASSLTDGVLYSRYGIGIVTLTTLEDFLWEGIPPFLFSSPGGIFARLDSHRLRQAREQRGLSLGALADVAGVSRRTIQLYEEGAGAEVDVVERLERFLGETLAAALDPFTPQSPFRSRESEDEERVDVPSSPSPEGDWIREVFAQLDDQGWDVVVTTRSPFDALARPEAAPREEVVLMGVGDLRSAERRASLLGQIARVAEGQAFFVVPERKTRTNIHGTPLVTYVEIRRRGGPEELRELLSERARS